MNMSFVFWIATVVMAVAALSFLVFPIILKKKKPTGTVWVTAIALPALAIGLYMTIGRPGATDSALTHASSDTARGAATRSSNPGPGNPGSGDLGSVQSMLTGLEARLSADPTDAKGWLLLAKSYAHLGRSEDAAAAYAKASDLGQLDSDFEAQLTDAKPAVAKTAVIRGRLTIADSAKSRLDPEDSVFIFAKSTDGAPMPVAVLRKVAADLPFDFELSDKQAMSPAAKLSSTATVTITARVSKSGDAMQAEPGLEVVSESINVGDDVMVELHLDPAQSPLVQSPNGS